MNKQTNKLIPEIRFPEFKNEGEWEENELNDFCFNISSGKDKNSEDGSFELYGSTGIIGKTKSASYKGDHILVARVGANAGLLNRAKGNFGVTDNTLVLDLKKIDSTDFIQYNLEKVGLNKLVFGSGQPLITGGQLKRLLLLTPKSDTEQHRIASCLSSLDEVITAHNNKLETLKTYKKGLMQNLFPQEGEKVPKLRFKEFEKDGEWKETTLGKIGKFSKGKGISKNDIEHNGNFECIRYGELYTTYGEIIDEVVSKTNLDKNELNFSEANDVILPSSGETQIDIAKASCIIRKNIAIGGDINIFKSTLNGVFLSYYLNSAKKMEIAKLSQGISVVHLYSSQLENLIINYPISSDNSQKEQQKIANTLSSLDNLIKEQADKIEQLKLHKKGLMQGLFPKVKA